MKPGLEDFAGIIEVNLDSPFVHFKPDNCAVVKKYQAVVDGFCNVAKNYADAVGEIDGLIEEIGEFPGKIQDAADGAKADIDAIEDF